MKRIGIFYIAVVLLYSNDSRSSGGVYDDTFCVRGDDVRGVRDVRGDDVRDDGDGSDDDVRGDGLRDALHLLRQPELVCRMIRP
jgi:hypothetical protein